LIGRILSNGRCEDVAIRGLLQSPRSARRVGLALALQRLLELAYGRTTQADGLARRLARLELAASPTRQQPEGERVADLAATSVVANALLDWLELAPSRRVELTSQLVDRATRRCLSALARAQHPDGSLAKSSLLTTIVLWQLGDHARFERAVRSDAMKQWLETRRSAAAPDEMRALAYAPAA
jgi:hypothetical protein